MLMMPRTLIMDLFVGNFILQMLLDEHKCNAEYRGEPEEPVLHLMPYSVGKYGKSGRNT